MTLNTSTLRPGLLVSLKTSVRGGINYQKIEIEADHLTEEGKALARWETSRVITLPEEFERARKVRSKARSLILSRCTHSAFGLLCPESAAEELAVAIKAAQDLATEFNETAELTRISVYVISGKVASDDVEAVKAINSEVRDLLEDMQLGIKNVDVKAIREAAAKAKEIGNMLSPEAQARVQIAVEAARNAAKKLVAAGDQAAKEIDTLAIKKVMEARTAFLDLDEAKAVSAPVAVAAALDLQPVASAKAPKVKPLNVEI
jgi:hypothetical protein